MEQRITLVTLRVTDVARSRAFYEGLGWQACAGSQSGFAYFQMGGMGLGLLAAEKYADEIAGDAGKVTSGPTMLAQNVRDKAEVDRLVSFALTQGGRLVRAPADQFWGGYSGIFADPDGHYWEIALNPYWPLAEDGTVTLA
ncbi:VOC family protein [Niveispirillum sp.]|uniref:VOC family protein n=1 Tax=Niveispirillum sp. TaxID=1917217 RepID=UPI001B73A665|nr:VOC family protein [Niveispirillum sp.]MBP7339706.1 VOC family protein [Niveispirillum sp.]